MPIDVVKRARIDHPATRHPQSRSLWTARSTSAAQYRATGFLPGPAPPLARPPTASRSCWPSGSIERVEQPRHLRFMRESVPALDVFISQTAIPEIDATIAHRCEVVNPMRGNDHGDSCAALVNQFIRQPSTRVGIQALPRLIEQDEGHVRR